MTTGRQLLRAWLDRSKLQQKDLASRLEITDAYLSQILSGVRRPSLEILLLIERATGVPVVSWADTAVGSSDESRKPTPIKPTLQRVK